MFHSVVVFTLLSCAFVGILSFDLDGRIVNGVDTTIQAYPYQVSLQTNGGNHFCGGSIISEFLILTAAHCMQRYKANEFKVRLGSTVYNEGGELVAVKTFKSHEHYNATTKVNDVAVIRLATPVRESANVRYIKLAKKSPSTGTHAVVTGWGTKCFLFCGSLPLNLQKVDVTIVSEADCGSNNYKYGSQIGETMICGYADKKDACQGDSGGPLVANNQLVGIVSWGIGCAVSGYPGVYCDVSSIRDWSVKTGNEL